MTEGYTFQEDRHERCDRLGRDIASRILRQMGYEIHEGGKYDVDLVLMKDGRVVGYVDVELRETAWRSGPFPFKTLTVLERRVKFAASHHPKPVIDLQINGDNNFAIATSLTRLLFDKSGCEPFTDPRTGKGDSRYHVALDHCVAFGSVDVESKFAPWLEKVLRGA